MESAVSHSYLPMPICRFHQVGPPPLSSFVSHSLSLSQSLLSAYSFSRSLFRSLLGLRSEAGKELKGTRQSAKIKQMKTTCVRAKINATRALFDVTATVFQHLAVSFTLFSTTTPDSKVVHLLCVSKHFFLGILAHSSTIDQMEPKENKYSKSRTTSTSTLSGKHGNRRQRLSFIFE